MHSWKNRNLLDIARIQVLCYLKLPCNESLKRIKLITSYTENMGGKLSVELKTK